MFKLAQNQSMNKLDTLLSSQETPAHHRPPLGVLPGLFPHCTPPIRVDPGALWRGRSAGPADRGSEAFVLSGVPLTTRKLRECFQESQIAPLATR